MALRRLLPLLLLGGCLVAAAVLVLESKWIADEAAPLPNQPVDVGFALRPATTQLRPVAVTVDARLNLLCWAEEESGRLRCADRNGARPRTVTTLTRPQGVALDPSRRRLYWTADGTYPRQVGWIDLGTNEEVSPQHLVATGSDVYRPYAIAVAPDGVTWSEAVSGRLRRLRHGESEPVDLISSGYDVIDDPNRAAMRSLGVASLGADAWLWSDMARATIESVDASGQRSILFDAARTGMVLPMGIAYDAARKMVYWADPGRPEIRRASISGSDPEVLATAERGLIEPRGLALDESSGTLYWADAARDVIGRIDAQGTIAELALDEEAAGFVETTQPSPPACDDAGRIRTRRFIESSLQMCLEAVDAHLAVKIDPDDVQPAARACVERLHSMTLGSVIGLNCAIAPEVETIALRVATRDARAGWKLEEIRPFVAAMDDPRRADALALIDAVTAAIASTEATALLSTSGVPASGQRVPYAAHRRNSSLVPVADDGSLRVGLPMRFIDNADGTITDTATGLQWEKKCDGCGGLHDVRRQSRWSSPHDETVWDWLAAINAEGGRGFAGYDDWRVPNLKELQSIVDYDRFNPSVGTAFDGAACGLGCRDLRDPACSCTENSEYWTATTSRADANFAWYVGFNLGLLGDLEKSDDLPMRAVRAGHVPATTCRDTIAEDGSTALLRAIMSDDAAQCERLIGEGADIRCRTRLRREAFADRGKRLPAGLDSLEVDPILLAAFTGNGDIVRLLLRAGADRDVRAERGHQPIHIAAMAERTAALEVLLEAGANVDAEGERGTTALMIAAERGDLEAIKLLLRAGADPNHANQLGSTALLIAVDQGHVDVSETLLERGALIEPPERANVLSPLMLAVAVDDREMSEMLLSHGADARRPRFIDSSALVDHGFAIEAGTQIHLTPLLIAVHHGNREFADLLVAHGADPKFINDEGLDALYIAVLTGNDKMTRWALEHGADPNRANQRGDRPLILAIEQANHDVAGVLLAGGADPKLADERGILPMQAAREAGQHELVALLARHGVEVDARDAASLKHLRIDTVGFPVAAPEPTPARRRPLGIAVDPSGGWLYWSEYATNALRRVRLDGGRPEQLAPDDTYGPIGIALGITNHRLDWTSDAAYPRMVQSLDLRTGKVRTIAAGTYVNRPRAIAPIADGVVWSEAINGRIRLATSAQPNIVDLVDDGISSFGDRPDFRAMHVLGIAVTPDEQRIFWSDISSASIETVARGGDDRLHVLGPEDGVVFPVGITFDAAEQSLYWTDPALASILRAPAAGGAIDVVVGPADGLVEPRAIAFDPHSRTLYWTDAALARIGRLKLAERDLAVLDLGDESLSFKTTRSNDDCATASRRRLELHHLRERTRLAVCLESIDAQKAVKRSFDDVRRAVPLCATQLAAFHSDNAASLGHAARQAPATGCEPQPVTPRQLLDVCAVADATCADLDCAVRACAQHLWRAMAHETPRMSEWLNDLRPFLADHGHSADEVDATTRAQAITVLDTILAAGAAPQPAAAGTPTGIVPSTGMTTSYRAVRRGQTTAVPVADDASFRTGLAARWQDHGDGTITDLQTGLMWEKKSDGGPRLHDVHEAFRWSSDEEATIWDWLDALNSDGGKGFAGYSDWRIPNIKELQSIVDYEVFNPAVPRPFHGPGCGLGCDNVRAPDCSCTAMSGYWSSTTYAGGAERGLVLLFNLGLAGDRGKDEPSHVRAVRNAVPIAPPLPKAERLP